MQKPTFGEPAEQRRPLPQGERHPLSWGCGSSSKKPNAKQAHPFGIAGGLQDRRHDRGDNAARGHKGQNDHATDAHLAAHSEREMRRCIPDHSDRFAARLCAARPPHLA